MNTPQVGDMVSIKILEIAHIKAVLAKSDTLDQAANTLGIDIATLYRKRVRYRFPLALRSREQWRVSVQPMQAETTRET